MCTCAFIASKPKVTILYLVMFRIILCACLTIFVHHIIYIIYVILSVVYYFLQRLREFKVNVREFTDANDDANKFKNRIANALPCELL